MGGRHLLQTLAEWSATARRHRQRLEQPIERSILAEEEDLLLAAEIVIEIARRQIRRRRDVAHAGGREPPGAEDTGRGAHDLDATGIGTDRTPVRKPNHRSILAAFTVRSRTTWSF
jgi:hypothetical protein